MLIAFIKAMPVMLEKILLEQFVGPPTFTVVSLMAPEPAVILLNVLPVMVRAGPLDDDTPPAFCQPFTALLPLTVIFEKLFPVSVITEPFTLLFPEV